MTLLRVGIISRTFYYTPLWAALKQRRFQKVGLDVQLTLIGPGDQAQMLRQNLCQLTIAPPDGILQDVDSGGCCTILAGNCDRLSHCLIVQPEIGSFADLRNKRIGVLSLTEGSFFHFRQLAKAHGMQFPEEFKVAETGGAPLRHGLLLEKKIDAGLQSFPWVHVAEQAGLRNLLDIGDYVPEWQFNTINADLRWCDGHWTEVNAFLAVLAEATDWFYENREGAAEVAAAQMEVAQEMALRAWDYFARTGCLTRDMSINIRGLAKVHESLRESKLLRGSQADEPFAIERYFTGQVPMRGA